MHGRSPGQEDRRVQRTQRALREAMVALILERGWDGFGIQDLCRRADVGRSTFYLHFADKEDVLGSGLEELRRGLRARAAAAGGAHPLSFARGLIEHAHEHGRVYRATMGKQSRQIVQRRFRELVQALVAEDLAPLVAAGSRRDAAVAFLAGALFDLILWSLETRGAPAPEELDALFQELAAPVLTVVAASGRRSAGPPRPASPRA